jgi:hypothetical protein
MARSSVLARAMAGIGIAALALAFVLTGGAVIAQTEAPSEETPPPCPPRDEAHAIVGGSDVQPTEKELKELGCPDVTPKETGEVDKLYEELMKESAPSEQPQPEATQ